MIVDEAFSNIELILNDMKISHQRIRSMFRFSMAQAAKNSHNIYAQHHQQNIFPNQPVVQALSPKEEYFLQISKQSENKPGSTMEMSDEPRKKSERFPDTLNQIEEDQNEINYTSIENRQELATNKGLDKIVTPASDWFLTNKNSKTNLHKNKSEFSPVEQICEFEEELI